MSLMSKIHDALVEDDPVLESAPAAATLTPKAYPSPTNTTAVQATPVNNNAPLRGRVEVAGGPMAIFNATLKSMAAYIPDEGARLKAAKEVLASQGISIEDVTGQFQAAIASIALETTKFAQAKELKLQNDVTSVQGFVATLASQIKDHESIIQKLVEQKTQAEISATKSKSDIESREQQFTSESVSLRNEYEEAVRKIQLYIGSK